MRPSRVQLFNAINGWPSIVFAALLLGACSTTPPPGLECHLTRYLAPDPDYKQPRENANAETPAYRPPIVGRDERFSVLTLSAGGEYGAYSTGFLRGWSEGMAAHLADRNFAFGPESFTVVTGVSAGAVIATHVFIGDFETIDSLYPHISGDQLYKQRWLPELLFKDSVFDTRGKERLLADNITEKTLMAVVNASGEKHRKLFLGAVDLRTGKFLTVDMTALAASKEKNKLECYRAIVSASSAIPIAFEPKFIDNYFLVDGGARHSLFLPRLEADSRATEKRSLVTILNNDFTVEQDHTLQNGLLPVATRTIEIGTDEVAKDSAYRMAVLAEKRGFRNGVYADAVRASQYCVDEKKACVRSKGGLNGEDLFCKKFMECLSSHGRQDGEKAAQGWWLLELPTGQLGSAPPSPDDGCYRKIDDVPWSIDPTPPCK